MYRPVVDVSRRELGQFSARSFVNRVVPSEDLILRLEIYKKLERHKGYCVNTVSFNADGGILVSGSTDKHVTLWNWEAENIKLSFHSGHYHNILQAKIMPFTDDRSIVTCGVDGQVRHAQILERGKVETALLARHHGRALKLAIEPGSPHIFYTCGEDGLVQHFDLRTGAATKHFISHSIGYRWSYMQDFYLNAIAINPRNPNLLAIAGSNEYARIYDIRKYNRDGSTDFGKPADHFCPQHLIGDKHVDISGLAFSYVGELLVSYINEFIYLFKSDMGLGPNAVPVHATQVSMGNDTSDMASPSTMAPKVYMGHMNFNTVRGVSFFGPKCEYVVSGSDCGRIFIWKKTGELLQVMEADEYEVSCVESHPHITALVSCGYDSDIKMWTPKALERAKPPTNIEQMELRELWKQQQRLQRLGQ